MDVFVKGEGRGDKDRPGLEEAQARLEAQVEAQKIKGMDKDARNRSGVKSTASRRTQHPRRHETLQTCLCDLYKAPCPIASHPPHLACPCPCPSPSRPSRL